MNRIIRFILSFILEVITFLIMCITALFYLMGDFALEYAEYGIVWVFGSLLLLVLLILLPIIAFKTKHNYMAITIPIIYFFILITFIFGYKYERAYIYNKYVKFNQSVWIENIATRKIMYKDLENNKEFLNYTKEQVIEKLGKPDSDYGNSIYYHTSPGTIEIIFENDVIKYISYLDW